MDWNAMVHGWNAMMPWMTMDENAVKGSNFHQFWVFCFFVLSPKTLLFDWLICVVGLCWFVIACSYNGESPPSILFGSLADERQRRRHVNSYQILFYIIYNVMNLTQQIGFKTLFESFPDFIFWYFHKKTSANKNISFRKFLIGVWWNA